MQKLLRRFLLPAYLLFIGTSFTGAYFSDSVTVSGNSFSAGNWSEPVINEIYSHTNSGEVEWIELYNSRPTPLSLDGYTIGDNTSEDNSPPPTNLSAFTIPANGYLVLEKSTDFSFELNNPGDIVRLKKSGTDIDVVAYGTYDDGNTGDNVPAAPQGTSIGRNPNGQDTNHDNTDFVIFDIPTKGSAN